MAVLQQRRERAGAGNAKNGGRGRLVTTPAQSQKTPKMAIEHSVTVRISGRQKRRALPWETPRTATLDRIADYGVSSS